MNEENVERMYKDLPSVLKEEEGGGGGEGEGRGGGKGRDGRGQRRHEGKRDTGICVKYDQGNCIHVELSKYK